MTWAAPRSGFQCGSSYVRVSRCPAACSIQDGWIVAAVLAHSRFVSTISATMTQRGGAFESTEPRASANRAPRGPEYSVGGFGPRRPD